MTPDILFDSESLRLTIAGADRPNLIVTFDAWNKGRAGFDAARAANRYVDRGFAHVHLSTAANDWFLGLDLPEALDAFAELATGYARRHALSFGMGGYGALLLAQAATFDQMLFVSPLVSSGEDQAPFDSRFPPRFAHADYAEKVQEVIAGQRQVPGDVVIAFDPSLRMDLMQARRMAGFFETSRMLRLRGAGHPATLPLARAFQFGSVVNAVLAPDGIDVESILAAWDKVAPAQAAE